jgi:hypothetical protein
MNFLKRVVVSPLIWPLFVSMWLLDSYYLALPTGYQYGWESLGLILVTVAVIAVRLILKGGGGRSAVRIKPKMPER